MLKAPSVDFDGLRAADLERLIEINPVTRNQMYHTAGNDVIAVIEVLGGKPATAVKLGVEEIEIEHWIDDHHVPTRYAESIHQLTGWSVWSIQVAPCGSKTEYKYNEQRNSLAESRAELASQANIS